MRRHYPIRLIVNGRLIEEVVIDPHYEEKHSRTVTDGLILELIRSHLDGGVFEPVSVGSEGHRYFSSEPLYFEGKPLSSDLAAPGIGQVTWRRKLF